MTNQELRKQIAHWLQDNTGLRIPEKSFKDYLNDADQILKLIKDAGSKNCPYCGKKPDGAMLTVGYNMAHADCVIKNLNKLLDVDCVIKNLNRLLDPDWEVGDSREPMKVVGYLAGYVKLDEKNVPPSLYLAIRDAQWDYIKSRW